MGRGNYCPNGKLGFQWYIDYENYKIDDEETDYELCDEDIRETLKLVQKRFPSFESCDRYPHESYRTYWSEHILLENRFFEIGTAENEWSEAVFIREKSDTWPEHLNLCRKHFEEYKKGIEKILLDFFEEVYVRNGAWMSSVLKREELHA